MPESNKADNPYSIILKIIPKYSKKQSATNLINVTDVHNRRCAVFVMFRLHKIHNKCRQIEIQSDNITHRA